jgi:hypothetical protein
MQGTYFVREGGINKMGCKIDQEIVALQGSPCASTPLTPMDKK